VYRPTEQENYKPPKPGGKDQLGGALGTGAVRVEKTLTGFLKKMEKKYG
jgi:hypothetical protein